MSIKELIKIARQLNREYRSGPHYKHQSRRNRMYWDKVAYQAKKESK